MKRALTFVLTIAAAVWASALKTASSRRNANWNPSTLGLTGLREADSNAATLKPKAKKAKSSGKKTRSRKNKKSS